MTRRILVADDSKTIRTVVDFTFRSTEFEVFGADSAEDAIAWLESGQADVILADVDMPQMDGYKLCDFIRSNAKTAHLPVLLLGGGVEPIDETRAAAVGANGHLKKPFDSKDLIEQVSGLCGVDTGEATPLSFAEKLAAEREAEDAPLPLDLSLAEEVSNDAALLEPLSISEENDGGNSGTALGKMRLKRVATMAPMEPIGAIDSASRSVQGEAWAPPPVSEQDLAESQDLVFADAVETDESAEEAVALDSDDLDFDSAIDFEAPEDSELIEVEPKGEAEDVEFASEEIEMEDAELASEEIEMEDAELASEEIEMEDAELASEEIDFEEASVEDTTSEFGTEADDLLGEDSAFQMSEDVPISDDVDEAILDEAIELEEEVSLDEAIELEEEVSLDEAIELEEASVEDLDAAEPDLPSFGAPASEIMAAAAADDLADQEEIAYEDAEMEAVESDFDDGEHPGDDQAASAEDFETYEDADVEELVDGGPTLEPPPSPELMAAAASAEVDVWSLAEPIDAVDDGFSETPLPVPADEQWPSDAPTPPLTDVPTEIGEAAALPPIAAQFSDVASSHSGIDSGFESPYRQPLMRDPSAVLHATAVVEDAVAIVTERAERGLGLESLRAEAAIAAPMEAPSLSKEELTVLAREAIEKIAWEVVPELAESIIRSQLGRLLQEQAQLATDESVNIPLPRQNTPPPPPPPADEDDEFEEI